MKGRSMEQILREKHRPESRVFQKLRAVFVLRPFHVAAEKGQRLPMHWPFRAL